MPTELNCKDRFIVATLPTAAAATNRFCLIPMDLGVNPLQQPAVRDNAIAPARKCRQVRLYTNVKP